MKDTKIAIIAGLIILFANPLWGQCPEYDAQVPHLVDVELHNIVKEDNVTGIFSYIYSLKNGDASTGCINTLEIDLTYPPNGVKLSKEGLFDYPKYVHKVKTEGIIPVGIPGLPGFKGFRIAWFSGTGVSNYVDWIAADIKFNLESGAQLDSIIMTSHGLPGFRDFVVSPKYDPVPPVIVTPENEDSVRANVPWSHEEEMVFQRLLDSIKWRGITVGPTAPPIDFIPTIWCDTLLSYTRQSVQLGWLKSSRDHHCDKDEKSENGISKNIERRILRAKKELNKGNTIKAVRELNILLKKVERIYHSVEDAQSIGPPSGMGRAGHHEKENDILMTSEAYALLKYNTEYLIEQLKK